jgi:hypothetical protein
MVDSQYQINLERTANQPVAEGIHAFKIASGEEGEGPKGPYWKFQLACLTPGEEGKTVFFIVSLSPQARWRLELFLDAVGAPGKGGATVDKFVGRSFRAQINHEPYEGRMQARVAEMFPITSSGKVAPTPAPVVTKVSGAPVEQKAKGLPADATQDEIPF